MTSINELRDTDTRREHLLSILAWPLMGGVATSQGWLQLTKNNVATSSDDENLYATDWVLTCDSVKVGYVDTEEKRQWVDQWPYAAVNIAKHPMSHWEHGHFSGRLTNKLLSFQDLPEHSWWVGMRKDWQSAVLVNAADLFKHGREYQQPTRYSKTPLPVLTMQNEEAFWATNHDQFCAIILQRFEAGNADR
jgi:hypothetical protein